MNAADPAQVKQAGRRARSRRVQELVDLRAVLALPEGRRLLWRLLQHAGVFRSVWESSAKIHYNAGRQDFGHFIMVDVMEAQPEAYLQMQQESRERELAEQEQEDKAHA